MNKELKWKSSSVMWKQSGVSVHVHKNENKEIQEWLVSMKWNTCHYFLFHQWVAMALKRATDRTATYTVKKKECTSRFASFTPLE